VNCYRSSDAETQEVEIHPYDAGNASRQLAHLAAVKARRADAAVRSALDAVSAAARDRRNVMPAMLEAVKSYATVGEITQRLVDVYGRYREPVRL
jgi:methylmalonyl-CoA mutase N-terminal domain/subunit